MLECLMAARVAAFMNFKGGVGKTASVVNLAACLARQENRRVLVVDLDAQANASLWLMTLAQWQEHVSRPQRTVTQIFSDYIRGTNSFDFDKAVVRGVPFDEAPLIEKLDLLPSSVELLKIEDRIHDTRQAHPHTFLRRALAPVLDDYDDILLDCPPNVYSVTRNALFAADYLIVPYIPDFLSLSGAEVLVELVSDFYDRVAGQLSGRKRPAIAGFLVSHFMSRQNVLEQGSNDLEVLADILRRSGKVHSQARVLRPPIRRCVQVAASAGAHRPVVLYAPTSNGALDYSDLARDYLDHFDRLK